ncbi:MAG: four helix bundle protein [Vulcanimicrobiota bacterium]
MHSQPYQKLVTWQRAMDLVPKIYKLTNDIPPHEQFGLISQIQRASVLIAANIAEGQTRESPRAFAYHLSLARGKLAQVETLLQIALKLHYIRPAQVDALKGNLADLRRLLAGLVRKVEA